MDITNATYNPGSQFSDYTKKQKLDHPNQSSDNSPKKAVQVREDSVFLNNIRPTQAREFLHNQIGRSVSQLVPQAQTPPANFARSFANADATASRIIDNVSQAATAISTGDAGAAANPNNDFNALIQKIQEGFQQARDALEQLNVMSQGFAPEFDQIQQKVTDFLQYLKDPENNAMPTPLTSEPATQTTEVMASQQSYQASSQASIQIETLDGDIVTVDLSNSLSQQQSSASLQTNNFSGYVYEANSQSENSLTFTVSGSLDEGELTAISTLVSDIAKTVGQFEKGNVNAALNIAKNINTQSEELSAFNFSVKTAEQYKAIDLYQKTQVTTAPPLPASDNTPATANNGNTNGNIESIFSNSISKQIYAAESANILSAAATVNSIFDKFYEQLSLLNANQNLNQDLNRNQNLNHDTNPSLSQIGMT